MTGVKTFTCTKCLTATRTEDIDALEHSYTSKVTTNPTCTTDGVKTYTCINDSTHTYTEVVPATGHTNGTAVVENNVAPTCTATGSYDNATYCTVCKVETSRTKVMVDELGHEIVTHETQIVTCKQVGWKAYETCTRCDYTTYAGVIPMQHNTNGTGACLGCGLEESTPGLTYSHNADGTYTVAGIGSCTETEITIGFYNGKDVTSIGNYAFEDCTSLTSVTVGNSVTSIGYYAFSGCTKLASIVIPDSVTSISVWAFNNCASLTSVTIGNGVTSIGNYAFYKCTSLTKVNITDIAAWCKIEFADSDSNPLCYAGKLYLNGNLVTELVIPESVTSIGNYAFYKCTSLTSIVIPDSVTSIGVWAFYNCDSLTIYCQVSKEPDGWNSDWNCNDRPVYWSGLWHYDDNGNPTPNN